MNLPLPRSFSARAAAVCAALFALFYGAACFAQYRAFGYHDFDLAVHTQSLWNLLRGSLDSSILGVSWPGNHANWILVLLTPLFAVAPSPLTLLFAQTAALALAAWPIFLLARRELGDERHGLFWVLAYCLYAPVGHVALFEFHPVAFATPLLLAAFYCAQIGRDRWFVFWSALAASCQEDVPLLVVALCVYRFVVQGERRISPVLGSAMLLWFYLCIAVLGPHFNRGQIGWTNLYEQFGDSGAEIARNLILRPDLVFQTLWRADRAEFLLRLLGPFLFLPLLAPEILLIAAPSFAQHLLSIRPTQQSIEFHYTSTLTPFVVAAATIGLARLFRGMETSRLREFASEGKQATGICVALTLLSTNLVYGGLHRLAARADQFRIRALSSEKMQLLAEIPDDAAVICTFDVISRLAMRPQCFSLHYVVSGRTTLGGRTATPPQVEFALVDFADRLTFETFYHATKSFSEKLLREFFAKDSWVCLRWVNSVALFRKGQSMPIEAMDAPDGGETLPDGTRLTVKRLDSLLERRIRLRFQWSNPVTAPAPYWMRLELRARGQKPPVSLRRGPCRLLYGADELWEVVLTDLPAGEYDAKLELYDHQAFAAAAAKHPRPRFEPAAPAATIPIGKILLK